LLTLFFVGGGDTVRPQDRFADAANTGTTNASLGTPVRDGRLRTRLDMGEPIKIMDRSAVRP